MHRTFQHRNWLLLTLTILFSGCSSQGMLEITDNTPLDTAETQEPPTKALTKEDQKAWRLFQTYDQYILDESPMLLTSLGKKEQQSQWDDFSIASQRKSVLKQQSFLLEAQAIEDSKLSPATAQSLAILKLMLRDSITGYQYRHYQYPFNQMFGIHNYLPTFLMNDHMIDSKQDAEAYLTRLETIGEPLNDVIERVKENAQAGITAPKFTYPLVLSAVEALLQGYPLSEFGEHPLTKDFQTKLSKLSLNNLERETLYKRFNNAMLTKFKPSYTRLSHFIAEQQLLASK
jgi:uncharacterized protein (DUF885 family)